ncbi:LPXTG cell wall anchor domain-containing protein [Streptomyces genisteinicus]|uniref:LPXTG cell wall anchor domain-containing protein n=1 Tax=Streptomyces genisteinicus TaxID=2768068 RepID=A0A7H0HT50_9ACTN|nr:LPXTG cell wall anchor domain-containing protein [Streptomyces genisteinicus]QNP63716.1 LPXTG cell wall anchor domain-containing protein [Streptomyces genisteinicus]
MRTFLSAGALVTAAALTAISAPAAHAVLPASKGDNGTVKIHDAATGEELKKNEPKVCEFYLVAFKFDAGQKADWEIQAWANNDLDKGTVVESGSLTLDEEGHERTEDMKLPQGQYKLFWTFEGENGKAKHKVFTSTCEDVEPTPGASEPTPGTSEPTPGTSEPTPGTSTSAAPVPGGEDASGDLAETGNGAPLGLLAGLAAVLVAGGGYLLARRRTATRH